MLMSCNEDVQDAVQLEYGLLRRFKRQCHHYITSLPEEKDTMEWLALMQHYGAPTRLLDWTHSFFVALYFAVALSKKESAIWAVQNELLVDTVHTILPTDASEALKNDRNARKSETFDKVFRQGIPLVCPIKPYRFNDRLIIQQGAFLCPGDISRSFEDNLTASLSQSNTPSKITKIIIADKLDLRKNILKNLHHMNMNAATLFPGLAGFAQSLRTLLAFPDLLKP